MKTIWVGHTARRPVEAVAIRIRSYRGEVLQGTTRYECKDEKGEWHYFFLNRQPTSDVEKAVHSTFVPQWTDVYKDNYIVVAESNEFAL